MGEVREVTDGRWRGALQPSCVNFLIHRFTGCNNGLIPHSLRSASVYSLGEIPARRLASSSCFRMMYVCTQFMVILQDPYKHPPRHPGIVGTLGHRQRA